jgi:hypothetical protein
MGNRLLALAAMALAAAMPSIPVPTGRDTTHAASAQEVRSKAVQPELRFEDTTARSGLVDFTLTSQGLLDTPIPFMGGGLGLIDYNNDGWVDVFLVNGSTIDAERTRSNTASDRLYRNNGNGTFTDVTRDAGLSENRWGMGVAVADVDNNGFDDLFVTNLGRSALYLNRGDGTFADVAQQSALYDARWRVGAAFGDYDRDGDVDLFVSSYMPLVGTSLERRMYPFFSMSWRGAPKRSNNALYENIGGGRFRDVTERSGIGSIAAYNSLGVMWLDFDDDGDQDIFVANDEGPNYLLRNNGDGTFSDIADRSGVAIDNTGFPKGGMGVDAGDYNNDGTLDIVVTNFAEEYNTLYKNMGDVFTDATDPVTSAASYPHIGWGTKLADFDADGYLDWIVVNGHLPQIHDVSDRQPSLLFRNVAGRSFRDVTRGSGIDVEPTRRDRGLAVGDLNNDGLPDVIKLALNDRPLVFMNRSAGGNWLGIKLRGTRSNRSAIGARVWARSGSLRQVREVRSGDSYLSQSDLRIHFGLGAYKKVDELVIRWPSGAMQTLTNVPANRMMDVDEPKTPAIHHGQPD